MTQLICVLFQALLRIFAESDVSIVRALALDVVAPDKFICTEDLILVADVICSTTEPYVSVDVNEVT